PWYTRHPVPLDVVHTPCSVLRPLPAKTRRDSILPAPLFLLAVFECYGRRVFPYSPPVPRRFVFHFYPSSILPTSPSVVRIHFLTFPFFLIISFFL
ncbi:unnamed protein product, partial [Brassica rapa subsp. trilocularis]